MVYILYQLFKVSFFLYNFVSNNTYMDLHFRNYYSYYNLWDCTIRNSSKSIKQIDKIISGTYNSIWDIPDREFGNVDSEKPYFLKTLFVIIYLLAGVMVSSDFANTISFKINTSLKSGSSLFNEIWDRDLKIYSDLFLTTILSIVIGRLKSGKK